MEKQEKRKREYPKAAIFLNGAYPDEHLEFYRRAIQAALPERIVIAVDGALHLFAKLQLRPHVVLGDFDSVSTEVLSQYADCERQEFPRDKDATDGELAIRYAIERECRDILIYGAIDTNFETDQMLANIFLLDLIERLSRNLKPGAIGTLIDHRQKISLWANSTLRFAAVPGDLFSVIPISDRIIISIRGAKWNLESRRVYRGDSWTLRNEAASNEVEIFIRGTALLIHRHS